MIEASKKGDVDSTNILILAIASIKNADIVKDLIERESRQLKVIS